MSGSIIDLMCICIVNNPDANDWLPSFLFYNETKKTVVLQVIYGPALRFPVPVEHTIDGTSDLLTTAAGWDISIATTCLCAGAFLGFWKLIQQQGGLAACN